MAQTYMQANAKEKSKNGMRFSRFPWLAGSRAEERGQAPNSSPQDPSCLLVIYLQVLPSRFSFHRSCCCSVSHQVMSDCLQPLGLQHTSFPVLHHLPEFAQTRVYWFGDAIQLSHSLLAPFMEEYLSNMCFLYFAFKAPGVESKCFFTVINLQ